MAWNNLNVLAVVPARSGSKGISGKNLRVIAGSSLIAWVGKTLNSIAWIDQSIISTDSQKYVDEGVKFGLDAPFLRPAELSADNAKSIDVWAHAWLAAEEAYEKQFDISILLEPTSPLRKQEDIERTVKALVDGGYSSAATISKTPAHCVPEKTLELDGNGLLQSYIKDGTDYSLRQTIPDYYHRNGACYAATRKTILVNKTIIEKDCVGVLIDRTVINIDDEDELELSEYYLKK